MNIYVLCEVGYRSYSPTRKRWPIYSISFTNRLFRVKILLNFAHTNDTNRAVIIMKDTDLQISLFMSPASLKS